MKVKTIFLAVTLLQVLPMEKLVQMMPGFEAETSISSSESRNINFFAADSLYAKNRSSVEAKEQKQEEKEGEANIAQDEDVAWDFSLGGLKKLNPFGKDPDIAAQSPPKKTDTPDPANSSKNPDDSAKEPPSKDDSSKGNSSNSSDEVLGTGDPGRKMTGDPGRRQAEMPKNPWDDAALEGAAPEETKTNTTAANSKASAPKKGAKEPKPSWFALQRMWGSYSGAAPDKAGYPSGYGTLALLLSPDYRPGWVLPQLDLRGHVLEDNMTAANAGLVFRYIPKKTSHTCWIWGANVYYDYRKGHLGDYNQIGAGIEALGNRWEFRANGYFPFDDSQHDQDCLFTYPGGFELFRHRCEYVLRGFDTEIGYYAVKEKNYFIYAAAGFYTLGKEWNKSHGGGEFRIRPQYRDYVALDLRVSYDSFFEATIFQAEFIISLPFYQFAKVKKGRSCSSDRQIYQRVERHSDVMPYGRCCCFAENF